VQTPNDILVDKLGLDIPPSPSITLEYISEREVQISWQYTDISKSLESHAVEVNSKIVGETKKNETACSILNLTPGTVYDIRVFTISGTAFKTPSQVLRLRTPTASQPPSHDGSHDEAITIRAYAAKVPVSHAPASAPLMAREHSGGHPAARRGTLARRVSPATMQQEVNGVQVEDSRSATDDEADGNLASLSQRLRDIQQDIDTTEGQITADEEEYGNALKELEAERDKLKAQLKERDEASSDLRRQVHKAEAAARTAQSERAKKERLLHQRENQRKKRSDEIARWEDQISSMAEEVAGVELQKAAIEKRNQSDIREIRRKIEEEQKEVRLLDEENREKALQIKLLEEERQQMNVDEETDESREADRLEKERDEHWQRRLYELGQQYNGLHSAVLQAQQLYDVARDRLAYCESARRATAASFAPGLPAPIDMDAVRRGMRPARKPRHNLSLTSSVSSPRGAGSYDTYGTPTGFSAINASPTIVGPSFFNAKNGMTLVAPPESPEDDKEKYDLTSGAPMSPRADALLPADLLGDESADDIPDEAAEGPTRTIDEDMPKSNFPRLGPPSLREQENTPGSPSPLSSSSKSFSSPRESFTQMQMQDGDQASLRSGQESFPTENDGDVAQSNSKRLMSNLFSFNRQRERGKTSADQSPALGSLKSGQSQSFPRNFGDDLDPKARKRLPYGGNWAFPGNFLPRSSTEKESSTTRKALPGIFSSLNRSAATPSYDPFASRSNSIGEPSIRIDGSSPRPSSVYSFDKMPRPSMESQFHAWGAEKSGLRGSPLGPDWASMHSAYSRNASRRPSVHHGSTSNLSLTVAADADYLEPDEPQRVIQAPIGTRPTSSQRPLTPKLNPAAPSFTTGLFNRKDRSKVKDKLVEIPADDNSPPTSRKSKETPSMVSTVESRDSLERTTSGHSIVAGTSQGEVTPAKPTIFSKITRKASSNKFGSWKLTRERTANSAPSVNTDLEGSAADETTGSYEQLGKSLESTSTTPSGEKDRDAGNIESLRERVEASKDKKASRTSLSWLSIRGKKKQGRDDLTASEVSESSERASEVSEVEEDE
jgi:hypothetical protein